MRSRLYFPVGIMIGAAVWTIVLGLTSGDLFTWWHPLTGAVAATTIGLMRRYPDGLRRRPRDHHAHRGGQPGQGRDQPAVRHEPDP
jgi:hypothetical protein